MNEPGQICILRGSSGLSAQGLLRIDVAPLGPEGLVTLLRELASKPPFATYQVIAEAEFADVTAAEALIHHLLEVGGAERPDPTQPCFRISPDLANKILTHVKSKSDAGVSLSFPKNEEAVPGGRVSRKSGGSLKTELAYDVVINSDSTLQREWAAIHEEAMPVELIGTPGIITRYESESDYTTGTYSYQTEFALRPKVDVVAAEIRFLTFDVWGTHQRTLSMSEIRDFAAGERYSLKGTWSLYLGSECAEFYASLAYVSRARTAQGHVFEANKSWIVREAQKFSERFTEDDLKLEKPERRP
jgi:hypothetical protein